MFIARKVYIKGERLNQILKAYSCESTFFDRRQLEILGVIEKCQDWNNLPHWYEPAIKNGISEARLKRYIEYSFSKHSDIIIDRLVSGKMQIINHGNLRTLVFTQKLFIGTQNIELLKSRKEDTRLKLKKFFCSICFDKKKCLSKECSFIKHVKIFKSKIRDPKIKLVVQALKTFMNKFCSTCTKKECFTENCPYFEIKKLNIDEKDHYCKYLCDNMSKCSTVKCDLFLLTKFLKNKQKEKKLGKKYEPRT